MGEITLLKGGVFTETQWVYDEESEVGSNVTTFLEKDEELTKLMDTCSLASDVTLRDVFLVLRRNLPVYRLLLGNWVEEFCEEAFTKPTDTTSDVDFLELYWMFEETIAEGKTSFGGYEFPGFHGWGDWESTEHNGLPPNTKGGIGVEYTPVNQLLDLPLRLKSESSITQSNYDVRWKTLKELDKKQRQPIHIDECTYTLMHIIYGIIWELSFSGNPKDRDEKFKRLCEAANEVDDE